MMPARFISHQFLINTPMGLGKASSDALLFKNASWDIFFESGISALPCVAIGGRMARHIQSKKVDRVDVLQDAASCSTLLAGRT
jgi:hypothetical protein